MEKASPRSSSASRRPDGAIAGAHGRVEQDAELVAAEPVGDAAIADTVGQLRGEAHEQRVAGDVAEGVVVGLEAVEVEEHERHRTGMAASNEVLEHAQHQAAVAEARERVGQRFVARGVQEREVLGEHQRAAGHGRKQREGREDAGGRQQITEPADDHQRDRGEAEDARHDIPAVSRTSWRVVVIGCHAAQRHDERACRPQRVGELAGDVGLARWRCTHRSRRRRW